MPSEIPSAPSLSTSGSTTQPPERRLFLATLWRWKIVVMVSGLFGVVGAAVLMKIAAPGFEATARLWIDYRTMETGVHVDSPEKYKEFVPTQAEIIRSPVVVSAALARLPFAVELGPPELAVAAITEQLMVDPLIGTRVVTIRFRHPIAERAVGITQSVIDCYCEYVQAEGQQLNREKKRLLEKQDEDIRTDLARLERVLSDSRNSMANLTRKGEAAKIRETLLVELGQSLSATKSRRLELENHLDVFFSPDRIAQGKGAVTSSIESQPVRFAAWNELPGAPRKPGDAIPMKHALDVMVSLARRGLLGLEDPTPIREALLEATLRESRLTQQYGDKHPEIRGVREQIRSIQAQLHELVVAAPTTLQKELESLQQQEQSLDREYSRQMEQADSEIDTGTQVNEIAFKERITLEQLQRVRTSHEEVLNRTKQCELEYQAIASGRLGVVVRAIEKPVAVGTGLNAPLPLTLAAGGLLGTLAGALLVFQLNQLPLSRIRQHLAAV